MAVAEIVVVGGGVVGLSLADELARRGASVLCMERGIPGGGQSAGQTRIFRHIHDDPRLIRLALQARAAWHALEARAGERLVGDEGTLIMGGSGDEADRLEAAGVVIDRPPPDALSSFLPLATAEEHPQIVRELHAGAIRADRTIAALGRLLDDRVVKAEVFGISRRGSDIQINTSEGRWTCREVVVTAGVETRGLATTFAVSIPERRACHLRLTFSVRHNQQLPCLLDRSGLYGETVYCSPISGANEYAIGLSGEDNAVPLNAAGAVANGEDLVVLQRRVERYASRAFPGVLGTVTATRLCLATPLMSGDDSFAVWRKPGVTFIAGHNLFKFAPVLAQQLADITEGHAIPAIMRPT